MAKMSKKQKLRKENIKEKKLLNKEEAFNSLKEICAKVPMKFDETVQSYFRLGINPKKPEQQIRGTVVLPCGTGKVPKIIVFAQGEKVKEAEEAGVDFVGSEDLVNKIQQEGWVDFDVAISTPDMMKVVGKLGKILGPRGLMPNPKSGTVTFNISETVKEFKMGKVEYRSDASGIVSAPIGKISFEIEKLIENFTTLYSAIVKAKPPTAKGQYIRGIAISSTMGPGIRIDSTSV